MEGETEKKAAAMAAGEVGKKKVAADSDVSLKELSKKLNDFAKERDWEQYHSPRNLLLAMGSELFPVPFNAKVALFASDIFQRLSACCAAAPGKDDAFQVLVRGNGMGQVTNFLTAHGLNRGRQLSCVASRIGRHVALAQQIAEVGELSELFMWKGEVRKGLADWDEAEKEHLGEELSDVLLYLVRLSDICGVDLADAATRKIVKNAVKYPAPSKDQGA
ncbi:hypothetical protein HU200_031611 [Digitaria exilis]|uniref:dCTP pyrophosphatase 1 n=1 Tax=Digitaria exilis TaxID=1010633 RepID=A0A835EQ13_9POAL|nr:hypothetical protein HU200_031611 [Digitaria exilis]